MDQFSRFTSLPIELQDLIWKAAIPARCPTAYAAQLRLALRPRSEVSGAVVLRWAPPWQDDLNGHGDNHVPADGQKPSVFISTLASLLLTCRQSSANAIAVYNRSKPSKPMHLRELSHDIDASSDLVMIQYGWQKVFESLLDSVVYLERLNPLCHLGVQWPSPSQDTDLDCVYTFGCLAFFLSLWVKLKALYVVVSPDQICEAEKVDRNSEEVRNWYNVPEHGQYTLGMFLQWFGHVEAQCTANVFRCGRREYFELSADQVAKAGGLEEVGAFLAAAQQIFIDDNIAASQDTHGPGFIKCAVLSWRLV